MRSAATTTLSFLALLVASLALPGAGSAQETQTANSTGLTISGFVSGTLYTQDQFFGLFSQGVAANTAAPAELQEEDQEEEDTWFHGGDVRNTRLSLGFSRDLGEAADGWSTAARLEIDLFGGFVGSEAFGDEMPLPRLRLAYADITRGGTTVRIGQAWAPIFGAVPNSLSHIAFPLGYGSGGVIGWRFPGVFLYHDLPSEGDITWDVQLAAMAGSWAHLLPNTAPDIPSPGEASLFPQLEARLNAAGEAGFGAWNAYVVGHIDQKDMDGVGVDGVADDLVGSAVELGGRIRPGPVTVQGNIYYGQAVGQLLASITQLGDFGGFGAWGQVGYQLNPRFSIWGFAGFDDARDGDEELGDGARDFNRNLAGMLRFDLPGYALGLEWLNSRTDFVGPAAATSANQIALSVFYAF